MQNGNIVGIKLLNNVTVLHKSLICDQDIS